MRPEDTLAGLLDKATPGPWTWLPWDAEVSRLCRFGGEGAMNESGIALPADAALIVAAVNALPALLAVCEAAQMETAAEQLDASEFHVANVLESARQRRRAAVAALDKETT